MKRKGKICIIIGVLLIILQLISLAGLAKNPYIFRNDEYPNSITTTSYDVIFIVSYFLPSIVGCLLLFIGIIRWKKSGQKTEEDVAGRFVNLLTDAISDATKKSKEIGPILFDGQRPDETDYGYSKTNPICSSTLTATDVYLENLRTTDGEKFSWRRIGEVRADCNGMTNIGMDKYQLYLADKPYKFIYIVPYVSEAIYPPHGLVLLDKFADESSLTVNVISASKENVQAQQNVNDSNVTIFDTTVKIDNTDIRTEDSVEKAIREIKSPDIQKSSYARKLLCNMAWDPIKPDLRAIMWMAQEYEKNNCFGAAYEWYKKAADCNVKGASEGCERCYNPYHIDPYFNIDGSRGCGTPHQNYVNQRKDEIKKDFYNAIDTLNKNPSKEQLSETYKIIYQIATAYGVDLPEAKQWLGEYFEKIKKDSAQAAKWFKEATDFGSIEGAGCYDRKITSQENDDSDKVVTDTKVKTGKPHANKPAKYCSRCGAAIDNESKTCTGCGKQYFKGFKINKFSITIILLSFIIISVSILSASQYSDIKELKSEIVSLETLVNAKQEHIDRLKNKIDDMEDDRDEERDKLEFYEEYAVLVNEGSNYYHKYGCPMFDESSFWIYNIDAAESRGYEPCFDCY